MFYLLCRTVDEMSEDTNTNEQKFHVEEYAQNLTRKFNFSTNNSGYVIVTKLGKEVSKYFTRAPTIKFVLGTLDTGVGDGETSVKISNLPNELLRYIFLILSLEDRKMAVLVSQRWRKVGEDPVLWKWSVVYISIGEDIKKLSVGRLHYVQEISLDELFDGNLEEFFKATLELPKLKEISGLSLVDMRAVNSQLLGSALSRLEEVTLAGDSCTIPGTSANTTNEQIVAIFNGMAENSLIQNLALATMDLRTLELDAAVLVKVMSDLRLLELVCVNLTEDQFRSVFTVMSLKNRIKSLSILESNLSAVDPKLLGRVLSNLVEVELTDNDLTNQQVQALFTELKKNCQLKSLVVSCNDLSPVDRDDLATVVTNIEEVWLISSRLSTEQITAVLMRTQENSKLKKLHIQGNLISQVEPAIVTRAREIMDQLDVDSGSEYQDDESDEDGFLYASDEDGLHSIESDGDECNAIESDSGLNDDESDSRP